MANLIKFFEYEQDKPYELSILYQKVNSRLKNSFNLMRKKQKEISIIDFCKEIKNYNLKDTLISIAKVSQSTFHQKKSFEYALKGKDNEYLTNMYSLAKLAHLCLISEANDNKHQKLSEDILANTIYLSRLCCTDLEEEIISRENILSKLIKEQIYFQLPVDSKVARSYIMFSKILNNEKLITNYGTQIPCDINTIFEQNTGLTINEYFNYALVIFAWTKHQDILIDEKYFRSISAFKEIIPKDKLYLFFNFLKASYNEYRTLSKSKPYINILNFKPIIEFNDKRKHKYVIPNISCFLEKIYNNLYFDFENFYELKSEKERQIFRSCFGFIYQEYIGLLLKERFSSSGKIKPELSYKKNGTIAKFTDWILEHNGTNYLIEVKAKSIPLKYIYETNIEEYYIKTIIPEIEKFYEKVTIDINKQELQFLKAKKIVPILLFKDIPMINSPITKHLITKNIRNNHKLVTSIENNEIILMNCDEFEYAIEAIFNNVDIVDVFKTTNNDITKGSIQVMQEKVKAPIQNQYLSKIYNEIFDTFLEGIKENTLTS